MISFPAKLHLIVLALLLTLPACKHSGGRVLEIAYVSGVEVNLRDRVAQAFDKVGLVKNGDRVEVLDHDRRFVKVRTAAGQTGWMEQRYLVSQQVYDQLQKLTADNANDPVQAAGITRSETNLHVEPGRETEHLYQIPAGEKLSLLKRGTADKNAAPPRSAAIKPQPPPSEKTGQKRTAATPGPSSGQNQTPPSPLPSTAVKPAGPAPVVEDWWLVRDSHGRVGWVLSRMVDLDIPLDVAQYAEGQRIVALFVLNEVEDPQAQARDKKIPQYLMVLTEPKDGAPFDFNQIRVFTWNVKRHRYETAYRERFEGMLPVTQGKEDFGKEGVLPTFAVRVIGQDGQLIEQKYKLNTPIVRRVLAPGEEPVKHLRKEPKKSAAKKRRR
ncbi:MAG TPA: SH3 domain-containing protein [Terriglobales bacterium]|nr:SH3 domain-containing protein [Terriglobales bacterium]